MNEDRFTPANNFCQNPHYWHSVDPESTELEVSEMIGGLVRALQPELVIETGTAFAQTTEAIGRALKKNGHGRLVSLEIDENRIEPARQRCRRLPVEIVRGRSLDYTPPQSVDFLFFDSNPEERHLELKHFLPFVAPGTIVAFHDSAPHHVAYKYIQHLAEDGIIRPIFMHTPRGICLAEVL